MSTKINTAKIGTFVILAVLLLIVGLLAFGAKTYFVTKTKVETAIPGEVYGLSVGSAVQLRGVPIGKVTQISFSWSLYPQSKTNFIVVVFEIEEDLVPLPPGMTKKTAVKQATDRGLRAIVRSQGITGTSILALEKLDPNIYPPVPLDYTPRNIYIPSAPPQLTRMVESLSKTLSRLQEVDFASIGEGVTNTLTASRELVTKLGKIDYPGLGTNANALLVQLKGTSSRLSTSIDELQKTLNSMPLRTISTNANGLVTELRQTNVKLQTTLDKVGSAPLQQTVAELQQAFQSLNDVLSQLREYPAGFIFGKPPEAVEGLQPEEKR